MGAALTAGLCVRGRDQRAGGGRRAGRDPPHGPRKRIPARQPNSVPRADAPAVCP
jgi:hypothetical protein